MVYDEEGKQRLTFVGPYLENQTLKLTCSATGGRGRNQRQIFQASEATLNNVFKVLKKNYKAFFQENLEDIV